MKRGLRIALTVAALAYLGVCAMMFMLQRSLLYHPQPRKLTAPDSTMRLHVADAELIVTIRPHRGTKALVYFGGNAEDVSQNLESFAEAFPDYALFLLHYRGYGGSTGRPTEQANVGDAVALFQTVHAQHLEVAVIGRSLGSGIAVQLARQCPVSRLILVTPYDSIEQIAASRYPYLPIKLLLLDRYESGKYAAGIRSPTTIIAAEHDEEIPRASTEQLLRRFSPGLASMTVIPGTGHNDLGSRRAYIETIQAALSSPNSGMPPTAPAR